jgi:TPR repeat protein
MELTKLINSLLAKYSITEHFKKGADSYLSKDVNTNLIDSYILFKQASDAGDAGALYVQSHMLALGEGTSANRTKAFEMLNEVANAGLVEAHYDMAICFLFGVNSIDALVQRQNDNWLKLPYLWVAPPSKVPKQTKASWPGAERKNRLGLREPLIRSEPPPVVCQVSAWDAPIRERGWFRVPGFGRNHLSLIMGYGNDNDKGAALARLRLASDLGLSAAKALLGAYLYHTGEDPAEGYKLLLSASDEGDVEASMCMGYLKKYAIDDPKAYHESMDYFRLAMEKDDIEGIISYYTEEINHFKRPLDQEAALGKIALPAKLGFRSARHLLKRIQGGDSIGNPYQIGHQG